MDLLQTHLSTTKDIKWWTEIVWITCDGLNSHSDGTHSLHRILIYILGDMKVSTFSLNFSFSLSLVIFVQYSLTR